MLCFTFAFFSQKNALDASEKKEILLQTINDQFFIKKDLSIPFSIIRYIDLKTETTFLQKNQRQLDITFKLTQVPLIKCEKSCFFTILEIPLPIKGETSSQHFLIRMQENIHEQQLFDVKSLHRPQQLFYFNLDNFGLVYLGEGTNSKFFTHNGSADFEISFFSPNSSNIYLLNSKSLIQESSSNSLITVNLKKTSESKALEWDSYSLKLKKENIQQSYNLSYPTNLIRVHSSFFDYQFSQKLGLTITEQDPNSLSEFIISSIESSQKKDNLFLKKIIFSSINDLSTNDKIKESLPKLIPISTDQGLVILKKEICYQGSLNKNDFSEKKSFIAYHKINEPKNYLIQSLDITTQDFLEQTLNELKKASPKTENLSFCLVSNLVDNPLRLEFTFSPSPFPQVEKSLIIFIEKQNSYSINTLKNDYSTLFLWGNYILKNNLFETFFYDLLSSKTSL